MIDLTHLGTVEVLVHPVSVRSNGTVMVTSATVTPGSATTVVEVPERAYRPGRPRSGASTSSRATRSRRRPSLPVAGPGTTVIQAGATAEFVVTPGG